MNARRALGFFPACLGYAIGSVQRGIQAGLSGRWEGSEWTRERRRPGRALESQDRGLDYGVREDMISEARSQAQTFPLARSINRKYANHVVGSCRMKWHTGEPSFDKLYAEAWQTWMAIADLGGRHHFRKMSKIAVESVLRDGQIYAQHDRRNGFLQIGPIESDRVSSDGLFNSDRPGLIGGISLDANGRAKSIRVWDRTIYGNFENPQEIPRSEYVHVFDSDRFDAVTGVTHYHTILNAVRDLKEILLAERLSAKRNSKLALLIKSIMGGAAPPSVDLFENDDSSSGVSAKVNVEEVGDVATAYMFPNEEMKAHTSDRPSEGWRWLMEWLVREIAIGLDLPFGVVWNMASLGGPGVRFDIGQANRVFCAFLQDVLEPMWFRPTVGAWLTLEIKEKRLPFHPNWYRFSTPRPASLTIDLGRDSKAGIDENFAGLTTATDWYAEEDQDFEQKTEQLAQEAAFRRQMAIKYRVSVEEIRLLTQQGNPGRVLDDAAQDDKPPAVPLNGAQITSALEVMLKLRERALTNEAAQELLAQIGIARNKAASMVRNVPQLDSGAGDVSFKREVLKQLLGMPAAREAVYNAMDIEDLVSATGLPPETDYEAPWIPVVAPAGPVVNGKVVKDAQGDIVGGEADAPVAAPITAPTGKPKELVK